MGLPALRLCVVPGCQLVGHHTHERPNVAVRRWYRRARWARLRRQVLTEEPLCRTCQAEGRYRAATEVDHILKHEGDAQMFYNKNNLQGLCISCHAQKTQRGE